MPALLPVSFAAPDIRPDSFVKVLVSSQVGVFDESSMLQIIQLQQLTPFPGLVIDDQGHVVSFVGMRWAELSSPDVRIIIETSEGERHRAEVVGVDQRISLAILAAGIKRNSFASFAPFPQKGQVRFFSLGTQHWRTSAPFLLKTEKNRLAPKRDVQVGGLGRSHQGWANSVILNKEDKVVGIVTGTRPYPYSKTVELCEILPADVIRESAAQVLQTRSDIREGWLGVYYRDEATGRPAVISKIARGGPAEKAGLRPGDTIVAVKDQPIENWQRLTEAIKWVGAGNQLPLTVKRNDNLEKLSVRLSHRQDALPRLQWMIRTEQRWSATGAPRVPRITRVLPPLSFLGFEVDPLSAQLAEFFNCPDGQGLLVRQVTPDGVAQKAGLRAGDVLIRVNDVSVTSPADLHRFLGTQSELNIQFVRDRQVRKIRLQLP